MQNQPPSPQMEHWHKWYLLKGVVWRQSYKKLALQFEVYSIYSVCLFFVLPLGYVFLIPWVIRRFYVSATYFFTQTWMALRALFWKPKKSFPYLFTIKRYKQDIAKPFTVGIFILKKHTSSFWIASSPLVIYFIFKGHCGASPGCHTFSKKISNITTKGSLGTNAGNAECTSAAWKTCKKHFGDLVDWGGKNSIHSHWSWN